MKTTNTKPSLDAKKPPSEFSTSSIRFAGIQIESTNEKAKHRDRNRRASSANHYGGVAYMQVLFHLEPIRSFILSTIIPKHRKISSEEEKFLELQQMFRSLLAASSIPTLQECNELENPALRLAIPIVRSMLLSNGCYYSLPEVLSASCAKSVDAVERLLRNVAKRIDGRKFRELIMIPRYDSFNCTACRTNIKSKHHQLHLPIRVRPYSKASSLQEYLQNLHKRECRLEERTRSNQLVCPYCRARQPLRMFQRTSFCFEKFPEIAVFQLDMNLSFDTRNGPVAHKKFEIEPIVDLSACYNKDRKKKDRGKGEMRKYRLQGIIGSSDHDTPGAEQFPCFVSYVREEEKSHKEGKGMAAWLKFKGPDVSRLSEGEVMKQSFGVEATSSTALHLFYVRKVE